MEDPHLFRPLLAPTATTTSSSYADAAGTACADENDADYHNINHLSSNTSITFRLLAVIVVGVISIWANREASKGFDITIINEAKDSPAGRRFELFYISNDKATRILLNTSCFAENILYPNTNFSLDGKKQVQHVTLRLTTNTTQRILVSVDTTNESNDEFVISLSSSVMGDTNIANANHAIVSALQRGMARIWLWDGESRAPPSLIQGLVEYISMLAGFGDAKNYVGGELPEFGHICWDSKDAGVTARFLEFCEVNHKGFIQRLNQGMRQRWDNRTVDDALGMEAKYLCDSYKMLS